MDDELRRAHAELDEQHWWFRGRRRVIEAVLHRYVPQRAGTVIDLGCGAGGLLDVVAAHGDVVALESDVGLLAVARERFPSADLRHGDVVERLDELPEAGLITAFDVIEHLDDDVSALRSAAGRLATEGMVVVTVPALPSLWSDHDRANGHRRRYTRRTLSKAFEDAGLTVVHLSYFNTFLFPVIFAARMVGRWRAAPIGGSDFDRSAGVLDRAFARIFAFERHLAPRWTLPIGVSLIAVGRPVADGLAS